MASSLIIVIAALASVAISWLYTTRCYGIAIDVSGSQFNFEFDPAFKTLRKGCFGLNNIYHVVYFDNDIIKEIVTTKFSDIRAPTKFCGGSDIEKALTRFTVLKTKKIFVLSDGFFDSNTEVKYTLIS
jgi:hypothetical protein